LVAHHPVGSLGDHVDELPLPFVSPLRTDDYDSAGAVVEHESLEKTLRTAHYVLRIGSALG
jgi:hypothetical protein